MTDKYVQHRFKSAVRNHKMTIEQDDGVFRCINFSAPDTSIYQFRLTTWPGHLAISGDLDDFIFTRLRDMFDFFRFAGPDYTRTDYPNYDYWAEKTQAVSKHGALTSFCENLYVKAIRRDMSQHVSGMALSDARECVIDARIDDLFYPPHDTREAISRAQDWRCPITGNHPFGEFWDHRLEDYSFGFKFACHAVQWGIKQYDLQRQGRDQVAHDKLVLAGEL
ncbi:hypothetical protein [uncultured Roseobacter sp.]|uniref:hypothetical protein n=1 Tax=uncultured Roseobacter sp. TaxID=114847 RepID=UPI002634F7DB|nr:hypothetical protein [uncultured Roseobacter sp.]